MCKGYYMVLWHLWCQMMRPSLICCKLNQNLINIIYNVLDMISRKWIYYSNVKNYNYERWVRTLLTMMRKRTGIKRSKKVPHTVLEHHAVWDQDLDPLIKVHYLQNGICCDKLFNPIAAFKAKPNQHQKDFNAMASFLSQNINKIWLLNNFHIESFSQQWQSKYWKIDILRFKISFSIKGLKNMYLCHMSKSMIKKGFNYNIELETKLLLARAMS